MRTLFLAMTSLLMASCASIREQSGAAQCAADGGQLVSLGKLYPSYSRKLSGQHRVICNRPTTDAGKSCTDRAGQCQSLCLAPPGAAVGQASIGICAGYMLVPDGTLLVGQGKVLDPNVLQ